VADSHQALAEPVLIVGGSLGGLRVEAVQHESAPLLAVQWHPEDDAAERPQEQGLFDAFVQMATPVNQEAVNP
jgi:putative glutamine amidotransferase